MNTTVKTITKNVTATKKTATKQEEKTMTKKTATKPSTKTAKPAEPKKADKPATPKRADKVAANLEAVLKYINGTAYTAHKSHANRLQVKGPKATSFHIIVNADGARIFLHAEAFKAVKAYAEKVSEGLAGQYETAATFSAERLEKVLEILSKQVLTAQAKAIAEKAEKAEAAKAAAEKKAKKDADAKAAAK